LVGDFGGEDCFLFDFSDVNTIKRKNFESDKNKDEVPKPRRKKGELLRSARTHSFHEIKRTKSDIVENDKVQNSKCSNCQSSWVNV
jgi:hypothetical protein